MILISSALRCAVMVVLVKLNPLQESFCAMVDSCLNIQNIRELAKRCGVIPKDELVDGAWYHGHSRNAWLAQWEALREVFVFTRLGQFPGDSFTDTAPHLEDDKGMDVFIPFKRKG